MPSLTDHPSSKFVKLLYIGDSSTGKTGSLTSLVGADYRIRVMDFDNGLDPLVHFVTRDFPDKLKNVDFMSFRDEYEITADKGPTVKAGSAKAFIASLRALEKWEDGSDPAAWGENTVLVIDSFTAMGKAAFDWARGTNPTAKDPRQWYFSAQQVLENVIGGLTSDAFHSNVIIISHVNYKELQDGTTKGFPTSIGSAFGPVMPRYFNTLILADKSGIGKNVSRIIKTVTTPMIDLKNPSPFKVEDNLPLETGLATLFKKLKERQ